MPKKRPPPRTSPEDLLTVPEAAALVGLHRTHLSRVLREGKGPASRLVGRFRVIRRADLEAWDRARKDDD